MEKVMNGIYYTIAITFAIMFLYAGVHMDREYFYYTNDCVLIESHVIALDAVSWHRQTSGSGKHKRTYFNYEQDITVAYDYNGQTYTTDLHDPHTSSSGHPMGGVVKLYVDKNNPDVVSMEEYAQRGTLGYIASVLIVIIFIIRPLVKKHKR